MTERSQSRPSFFVGFLGFVGIGNEPNFVANEGLLGFERQLCVQQRGHGDEATRGRRGRSESRNRCHEANGYSHFDASTTGVGNWPASGAKRLRNNGLGF